MIVAVCAVLTALLVMIVIASIAAYCAETPAMSRMFDEAPPRPRSEHHKYETEGDVE